MAGKRHDREPAARTSPEDRCDHSGDVEGFVVAEQDDGKGPSGLRTGS